jgi:pimeloyl-ACP methyl ester carboxylesterase
MTGPGWSTAGRSPGVHDTGVEIADLKRLLDHAGIPPPYLLVGDSYGGLLVRLFAHAHPHDTAGLVLVDAMGRNQDRRVADLASSTRGCATSLAQARSSAHRG